MRYKARIAKDPFFERLFPYFPFRSFVRVINSFYPTAVQAPLRGSFFRLNVMGINHVDTQLVRFTDTLQDAYKGVMQPMKNNAELIKDLKELMHEFFRATGAAAVFGIGSNSIMNGEFCGKENVFPRLGKGTLKPKNKKYTKVFDTMERYHNLHTWERCLTSIKKSAEAYLERDGCREMFEKLRSYENKPVIVFDDSCATGLAKAIFIEACRILKIPTENIHLLSLVRESQQS